MKPRSPLFRQYLSAFIALAGLVLLITGAASLYFSSQDSRNARIDVQRESAAAATGRIEQRLSDIVHQIGLTAPLKPGQDAVAQRKQEIWLLRQFPAISDILLLDSEGQELLRISRHGDVVADSKTDYSRNAAFQEAKSGQPYFSPVYFRGDNEPHITISIAAGPEQAGITVAEIDLRFLLDGLGQAAASGGQAHVTDARGQLIAIADPELKLQKADLASQQVDGGPMAAPSAYAMVAPLGWRISVEQPQSEALAPLYALAVRSALLLLAGLLLSVPAGFMLARRLTNPLRELQERTDRIAQAALGGRIEAVAGNELEALAARFNQLADRLQESRAQLERNVEDRALAVQEVQRLAECEHRRMAEMIEALPLAVYQFRETADGELHFTFVSENARDVLGVSAAEIMADKQARWRTTLPEDRLVIEPVLYRAQAARQAADFHHRVQFDGGATRWIRSYTAAPRQADGGWVWNGCWLDQTQARKREEEMRAAKEAAEALARTRSVFLSNISHELRTPLNTIIGLTHLALKTELTPQQLDAVNRIHQEGTGLFSIINDILDFARIDAGRLVIENTGFTLGHVVENVAAEVGQAAADKGLTLTFDIPQNMPQSLTGDPVRLEQILTNLAGNAVKFTERGEITVRVERIYSTDKQVMLRFLVCDTGIGMTVEQRERLFQAPLRDDSPEARKYSGIGLGLIICKHLAEMMGGSISVESKLGAGSTFSFTARFGLGKDRAPAQPSGIEGMRVLPEDDNELNQQVATELLEAAGAQVVVAAKGRGVGRISKETFQQLVGYLSSGDPMSLDCFAEHRDELSSALGRQTAQVEQAICRLDFETALSLLDAVMTRLDIGFER